MYPAWHQSDQYACVVLHNGVRVAVQQASNTLGGIDIVFAIDVNGLAPPNTTNQPNYDTMTMEACVMEPCETPRFTLVPNAWSADNQSNYRSLFRR